MRWKIDVRDRVYVRCVNEIGQAVQVGKVDVAVVFPNGGLRVFLWDEGIVPVDLILDQCAGLSVSKKRKAAK